MAYDLTPRIATGFKLHYGYLNQIRTALAQRARGKGEADDDNDVLSHDVFFFHVFD